MIYEVQTYTLCGGWINTWTDDGDTLVTFDTLETAQKELKDYLEDLAYCVKTRDLADYNPKDYKIVEVTE